MARAKIQTTNVKSIRTSTIKPIRAKIKSDVKHSANELLNDGRKLANSVYKEGLNKVNEVEDSVKEYSDELLKKVKDNPLTSVLVAGGVGFLLSMFLRK